MAGAMVIVYGLCDPETRELFYVGLTRGSWRVRLAQHSSDPASAAYYRIKAMREDGREPICIVLKCFSTVEEARVFERDIIVLIDRPLLNREPRYGFAEGRVDYAVGLHHVSKRGPYSVTREPFDDGWDSYGKLND